MRTAARLVADYDIPLTAKLKLYLILGMAGIAVVGDIIVSLLG